MNCANCGSSVRKCQVETLAGGSLARSPDAARDRAKKSVRPRDRRVLARWAQTIYQVSERRVSRLLPIAREPPYSIGVAVIRRRCCVCGCESWRRAEYASGMATHGVAETGGVAGGRQTDLSAVDGRRSDGAGSNTARRPAGRALVPQPGPTAPNQGWSMDFMSERVADGRWFRILTVVDQFTRNASVWFYLQVQHYRPQWATVLQSENNATHT